MSVFKRLLIRILDFAKTLEKTLKSRIRGSFILRLPPEAHNEVVFAAQLANKSLNTWLPNTS